MAISWHEIASYCKLGIDWFASSGATSVSITPKVYRYDLYNTDNYGGSFDEVLSPDPVGAGSWSDLSFGKGSGTRAIDTFATRTYTRTHKSQTVTLKLEWENIGSFYSGSFKSLGSGSKTWTLTIDPLASYTVSYNANGGSGAPSSQTKWYGEELTLSSTTPTRTGYTFQGWATTSNATSAAYAAGGKYTANSAATLYAVWKVVAPAAPSGCTNTRNSDTSNTVAWTRGTNADVTYSSIKVERSTDGGSWSEIASVAGTATSYVDSTTSADHYYRYRVRAHNSTDYSSYATSGYTYNTPAAPTRVRAYRTDATTVKIEVTNASRTATALEVQRSTDEATWSSVATVSGTPVIETTDTPGGGTFYYRVRNTRDSLASDWSPVSNGVVTIVAPAAPTLISPASGIVVSKAQEVITFEWLHNPIDGSAQTAAELRYSLDGGSNWEVIAVDGNVASYALSNAFAVNSSVTWGVRTKGAHKDFGPWSGNRTFNVYQQPLVAFAQPTDGFVIENAPVAIQLQYEDPSGTLADATLTVSDGARVVYTRDMGTETSCEILASEWLPDDGAAYTLIVSVRSSSTLTASAVREVTVSFVLPKPATLSIEPDPETGYVSLIAALEEPEPRSITWDGDTTGLTEVAPETPFYKVSDLIISSVDELVGQSVSFFSTNPDIPSFTEVVTADAIMDFSADGMPILMIYTTTLNEILGEVLPIVYIVYESFSDGDVSFSTGVYFFTQSYTDTGVTTEIYTSELTLPSVELEEPKSISVYREVNGERVLLGEGLQAGAGLVDRYAPANVPYRYVVISVADSGAISTTYVDALLDTQWFYFIWDGNVAKGRINPEGSKKLTRPNRRRQHFAGRQSPVSFDDGSVSDTRSVSVLLRTKEEADAFEQMIWDSGRCVYKSGDGDVIHADVELSDRPAWTSPTYYGSISVSLTRIDGEAL